MNTRHSFFVQNYFIYIHTFLDFFPPRLKNSFYLFFYHNSLKIHFNFRKKYLHTLVHISFALLQCLCCCWHLHIALIRKNANAYKVRKRLHASSVARTLTDFYTHTNIHTPYMNNVQKFYISLCVCVYVCIKLSHKHSYCCKSRSAVALLTAKTLKSLEKFIRKLNDLSNL